MPDTDKAKLEEFRTRNGKHPKYQVSFNGFILHTFDSKNSAEIYVNGFNQMHHQSLEAAKREAKPDAQMLNDLIVYAERYAINRMSYANGSVADDILKLCGWGLLYPKTTSVLVRDIEQAFKDDVIPYDDQKKKWREVLAQLKSPGKGQTE